MTVDAGAWTSLANVKEHLDIDGSDTTYDAFLTSLVNRSYKVLEAYIGHAIKSATYTEDYDGDSTNSLLLKNYPIISITSIYDDVDRNFTASTLIPAADYVLDKEEGMVRLFQNTSAFKSGILNVRITYVAGYATIPADVEMAGIAHVAWMYRRANTEGTTAQTLGGKSEQYEMSFLPEYLKQMLRPYRKIPC